LKFISQECLNGEFVRVGSNPKFQPVAAYHWYIYLHYSCQWLVFEIIVHFVQELEGVAGNRIIMTVVDE